MIGKSIGHYSIISKLGKGGMGEVYLAEDTKLNRNVAIKFLPSKFFKDDKSRTQIIKEAQIAASLDHPNIVTIYEINEYQEQPYIVMQYVEGQLLNDLIKSRQLSIGEVLDLTISICEGLNKAHLAGIVHRDIKPSNIIIDKDGRPRLLDFGLASIMGSEDLNTSTSTAGTLNYMSPEQAQGQAIDARTDIFSIGAVMYEMISGQILFKGDFEASVIYSIVNETPEPLSKYRDDISDELQNIVSKALEKKRENRYQTVEDLLNDLKQVKNSLGLSLSTESLSPSLPEPKNVLKRALILALVIMVVVSISIAFKPWEYLKTFSKEAVAGENRLAIMYFENLTETEDTSRFGEIITNLLITDLSESEYIQVVSSQHLYDILKGLGQEGVKKIDRDVASKVASKANANWMLLGSIFKVVSEVIITAQLVDVATGNAIASQRIVGNEDEDIFALVDKLTTEIKKDLSLPADAQKELDRNIAEATTHSTDAYRYYLEGLDNYYKFCWEDAAKSFTKSIELDSTFAMAYYGLALLQINTNIPERKVMIAQAVKYSNNLGFKDKCRIKSIKSVIEDDYLSALSEMTKIVKRYPDEKEAFYWMGFIHRSKLNQPDSAVFYFNKAIILDSLYGAAYNELTYAYMEIGDFENLTLAANTYITLNPNEPNPWDTKGDIYCAIGMLDEAITSYEKANGLKTDFYESLGKLGNMYLFKGSYFKAEDTYRKLVTSDDKGRRAEGRTLLSWIPIFQGKFKQALQTIDDCIASDKLEMYNGSQYAVKHFLKAAIYEELELYDLALNETTLGMQIYPPGHPIAGRHFYAKLLAENGNIEKAMEVAESMKMDIEAQNQQLMYYYWYAIGCINFTKRELQEALLNLEKTANTSNIFYLRFMLAKVYLELGKNGEAVEEFENLLSVYNRDRLMWAISYVKIHYYLGIAYENSGWNSKAIDQYEEFLDIWKDADSGIPEIKDARSRISQLKTIS